MKSDLLADLRAEVEAAAQAERTQRALVKAERLATEARVEAQARAVDEAAVAARLDAEARRQTLLVQARAALAQPAKAIPVRSEDLKLPIAAAASMPSLSVSEPPSADRAPPRGSGLWLAVMGVPLVCATVIAIAVIWSTDAPPPSPIMLPPAPMFQVVDSPTVPDAPVMPTAHMIATPASVAAPPSVAQPVRSVRAKPRRVRKAPPAASRSVFSLGADFMDKP